MSHHLPQVTQQKCCPVPVADLILLCPPMGLLSWVIKEPQLSSPVQTKEGSERVQYDPLWLQQQCLKGQHYQELIFPVKHQALASLLFSCIKDRYAVALE